MDGRRGSAGVVGRLTGDRPSPDRLVVRARLEAGVVTVTLDGAGQPDLATVDDLAELALLARRRGLALRIEPVTPALRELLELCGLRDVLPGAGDVEEPG